MRAPAAGAAALLARKLLDLVRELQVLRQRLALEARTMTAKVVGVEVVG